MNTQCTQRCGRPPSKHRLSLRYRKQGSFFVGAAAVKADEGQPKDDARSSQRGAKQEFAEMWKSLMMATRVIGGFDQKGT